MRILIAEDDEFARMILQSILETAGYDVVVASDGWQALQEYRKRHFPVVISDWFMPMMDGVSLCREIRQIQGTDNPLIVMITAITGGNKRQEAIDAGVDDFIPKPVDVTVFQAWCKRVLETRLTA